LVSGLAANSTGEAPPEFLSTHPSDASRIASLKAMIPQAKATAAFGMIYK
jgi:predicted Zn-dependent protease